MTSVDAGTIWSRICAWVAIAIFMAAAAMVPARAAGTSLLSLGERLYHQGVGASGRPIPAFDRSGQPIVGPQSHCVSCHRASGYGSNEGSVYVPPITGPILFSPKTPDRNRLFPGMFQQVQSPEFTSQLNGAHMRPAYDTAKLARLLREGVDATGARISAAMPRYRVSDGEVAALAAWLKALSARPDPGVDETSIRFAVIVSDRTAPEVRKAVIDTARAFAVQENRGTRADQSRPNFSPYYRSGFESFWRLWDIHVWELHGPEESWRKQLEAYYAAAPVFAVASSAVAGPWRSIGRFCDDHRLPCLFPLTDLPLADSPEPGYTLYLSGGLPLEARAMAARLASQGKPARVVQVADASYRASVPASVLRDALAGGDSPVAVRSLVVSRNDQWTDVLRRAAAEAGASGTLVVWPGEAPEPAVEAVQAVQPAARLIFLPSAAEATAKATLSGELADRIRIMHPAELPTLHNPHSYRIRQWLNARGIALNPPEAQYLVYYSLSVLEKALMEIQGDFSRDYLIEHIETVAESNLNPGVFPTMSLGPGQRYASRGSYVVRLDKNSVGGIRADGNWIVP